METPQLPLEVSHADLGPKSYPYSGLPQTCAARSTLLKSENGRSQMVLFPLADHFPYPTVSLCIRPKRSFAGLQKLV